MRWPVSRLAKEGGKGKRMSARRNSTLAILAPSHRGFEAAPHSLDLRQFRHFESPNSPVREPRDFLRLL